MDTMKKILEMAERYTSTVYRNTSDTVRLNVSKVFDDENRFTTWDAFVFHKHQGESFSWCSDNGEGYTRKNDLMRDLVRKYGPLKSMGNISSVTHGW